MEYCSSVKKALRIPIVNDYLLARPTNNIEALYDNLDKGQMTCDMLAFIEQVLVPLKPCLALPPFDIYTFEAENVTHGATFKSRHFGHNGKIILATRVDTHCAYFTQVSAKDMHALDFMLTNYTWCYPKEDVKDDHEKKIKFEFMSVYDINPD